MGMWGVCAFVCIHVQVFGNVGEICGRVYVCAYGCGVNMMCVCELVHVFGCVLSVKDVYECDMW